VAHQALLCAALPNFPWGGLRPSGSPGSISPFLVIQGRRLAPISWAVTANRESSPMDPFSFLVLITMATFTLCGGSILVSFLVMERNGACPRASRETHRATGRRARKRRNRR
jgi:hypothetical protein